MGITIQNSVASAVWWPTADKNRFTNDEISFLGLKKNGRRAHHFWTIDKVDRYNLEIIAPLGLSKIEKERDLGLQTAVGVHK